LTRLKYLSVIFAALIFSTLIMGARCTEAQLQPDLKRFLQTLDSDKTTRYIAAFRDLNSDGKLEAIVYLMGGDWCGSGGCTTLILTQNGISWKIISRITVARPPIRVLAHVSNGRHSIGVWVQGGGIQPGYVAELNFNGVSYPRNPSVPPAIRIKKMPAGEVVIRGGDNGVPLYDDAPSVAP
jgi:hypothetical protein